MKRDYNGHVDATAIATTTIGFIQAHRPAGRAIVRQLVVEQEGAADASFNVLLGASALFAGPQTVAAADTPEVFRPSQNAAVGASAAVAVDVTASSGTSGDLIVGVQADEPGVGEGGS